MKPALRFPSPNWAPEIAPIPHPDTRLALALLTSIVLCWGFWLVGYLSGRSAERGSQLAVVAGMVVRGPTIDSLADSSRAVLKRWEKGPRMPHRARSGLQPPPAPPTERPVNQPHPLP